MIDWSLPHLIQCPETIRKIAILHRAGNPYRGLKKYRNTRFFDIHKCSVLK